jgi:hypothetical protein
MLFLLWPIVFNPLLWFPGMGIVAIAIGASLIIANVNPFLGLLVAIF